MLWINVSVQVLEGNLSRARELRRTGWDGTCVGRFSFVPPRMQTEYLQVLRAQSWFWSKSMLSANIRIAGPLFAGGGKVDS